MSNAKGKGVNFTFAKKKKKESKAKAKEFQESSNGLNENEFSTVAEAAINETKRRKEEGIDLVIPLEDKDKKRNEPILSGLKRIIHGEDSKGDNTENTDVANNGTDKNSDEKEAEDALIQMASENQESKEYQNDSTNFSSRRGPSSLVIKQKNEESSNIDDTIKYQRDLTHRAEDISVHSDAYVNVPIGEFGAAMLRGMGWKSSANGEKKDKKETTFTPRPHRLGLGATPLPPSIKNGDKEGSNNSGKRHWARKGGTMADRARIEREEEEERRWKTEMEERQRNDVQLTLQVGSIVWVENDEGKKRKRAKMVKIAGVPGLNRVLVRYEGEMSDISVKKSEVNLIDKNDLERNPFDESTAMQDGNVKDREKKIDRKKREHRHERSRSDEDDHDQGGTKRKEHRGNEERCRDRKKHRQSDDERGDHKRRRSQDDYKDSEKKRKAKKSKNEESNIINDSHHERWLTPNIRVRVVTKKIAKGRQYKQKGIVMDVLKQGAYAIVHMDNGELIERIPERYLETALPKVGGNAIILTGKNQYAKGKLLERNSNKGRGVVQLFEDMNVVTLSLDDMAEWCGALDEDYE